MEIIIIWEMFLALATTELSFNQVMSLDTIRVVMYIIDCGISILMDIHLIIIVIQVSHLNFSPLVIVFNQETTDNH